MHLDVILLPFQVIRRFEFGQSQTDLNLTKFIDNIIIFINYISFIKSIIEYIFIINLPWIKNVTTFFYKLGQT